MTNKRPTCFGKWSEESEFCEICRHNMDCSEGKAIVMDESKLVEREYSLGKMSFREMAKMRLQAIKKRMIANNKQ